MVMLVQMGVSLLIVWDGSIDRLPSGCRNRSHPRVELPPWPWKQCPSSMDEHSISQSSCSGIIRLPPIPWTSSMSKPLTPPPLLLLPLPPQPPCSSYSHRMFRGAPMAAEIDDTIKCKHCRKPSVSESVQRMVHRMVTVTYRVGSSSVPCTSAYSGPVTGR